MSYKWDKEPEHNLKGSNDDELEPLMKSDYICDDTDDIMGMFGGMKMSHFSAFTQFSKKQD